MIEMISAVILAAVIVALARAWAWAHRRRMERLKLHRDKFLDHATRLAEDSSVDDATLRSLRAMALDISKPRMFWLLLKALSSVERELRTSNPRPHTNRQIGADFSSAVFHYLMAITYLRGISGILVRETLARVLDPSEGARNAEIINQRVHRNRLQHA